MTTEYRNLPIKLQEFKKIVLYLKNKFNKPNIDNDIFELAKNIRDDIIFGAEKFLFEEHDDDDDDDSGTEDYAGVEPRNNESTYVRK